MSQCWATHPSGIRCNRKSPHDGKRHRFEWADDESVGYVAVPVQMPPVSPGTATPHPSLRSVPTTIGVPDGIEPTGQPALTPEDAALAERPVVPRSPCVVCQHRHVADGVETEECPIKNCECMRAIPG